MNYSKLQNAYFNENPTSIVKTQQDTETCEFYAQASSSMTSAMPSAMPSAIPSAMPISSSWFAQYSGDNTPTIGYGKGDYSNYITLTFTKSGNFVFNGTKVIYYLLIAGGDGGDAATNNNGWTSGTIGKGGEVLIGQFTNSSAIYNITVGTGGSGGGYGGVYSAPTGKPGNGSMITENISKVTITANPSTTLTTDKKRWNITDSLYGGAGNLQTGNTISAPSYGVGGYGGNKSLSNKSGSNGGNGLCILAWLS